MYMYYIWYSSLDDFFRSSYRKLAWVGFKPATLRLHTPFATPSCKWDKDVKLQRKPYRLSPLV